MLIPVIVNTEGSAGSASGHADTQPLWGILGYVKRVYHDDAPNTTDYTLAEVGGPQRTLETVEDSDVDAITYPAVQMTVNGVAVEGAYTPYLLDGVSLRVSVEDCDELAGALTVYIQILPM